MGWGKEAHTVYCAGAASISADGRDVFLQGRIAVKQTFDLGRLFTLPELIDREIRQSGGSADICRIDARIVERLRPAAGG